ncbi:MAG: cyclic pyranopterin monophosphate synthase MoaC [Candidatus Tritonobacter lacicola]|nr:cyclic pyranopterin monophosphate synthase MoaC [Candidatus Tritonobacter lacicola]
MIKKLTHLNKQGEVRMVDVTAKAVVEREAAARAVLRVGPETVKAVTSGAVAKGNVTAAAKVAAITAAKNTFLLIPLCHQIRLTHVDVALVMGADTVTIETVVRAVDRTGVEMEALVAASVAALTVYDMCKAIDKSMRIETIELIQKTKKETAD